MYSLRIIILGCLFVIVGCENDHNSTEKLNDIIAEVDNFKSFDRKDYPLGLHTKENYKSIADFSKNQLNELTKIDKENLTESEKISLELLQFTLQEKIDFYKFEAYLNPLLSDAGFHTSLPYQVRDFVTHKEFVLYLKKLTALPTYVEQHITLMREGLEKGISQPKIIFNNFEDTYDSQIVDNFEDSFYYSPLKKLPSNSSQKQKDSLLVAAKEEVTLEMVDVNQEEFNDIIKKYNEEFAQSNKSADEELTETVEELVEDAVVEEATEE